MSAASIELETVTVSVQDGAATVLLNRPDTMNAWNQQFGVDCSRRCRRSRATRMCAAVVITGAGRGFSSGADLKDFSGATDPRWPP